MPIKIGQYKNKTKSGALVLQAAPHLASGFVAVSRCLSERGSEWDEQLDLVRVWCMENLLCSQLVPGTKWH
jgi:hypothetical protein